jgi:hypothetical protein
VAFSIGGKHMAHLVINEKEYKAQTTFKFERLANERYAESGGQNVGGFMSIYLGLLEYDPLSLLAFWDCALHHYKQDKPSLDDIENALEEKINADSEAPFKEVFKVLDEAGFFKKRVKDIWKELERVEKPKKDESEEDKKERQKQEEAAKMMKARRKELLA